LKDEVGLDVKETSIGSTPSLSNPLEGYQGITELHPGNYIFFDAMQAELGSCNYDDVAGFVLSTVVMLKLDS
jgi:D-serine deaminase-like pyridoxal phosphate-dependent protein